MGPGRNSKSPSRWFQIDEPVTSAGSRSGVNWTRLKPSPLASANERAVRVFASPGHVLEQHVAIGEQAEQDELELLALADDCPLDLGQQALAVAGHLLELHQTRSRALTTRPSSASSMPAP